MKRTIVFLPAARLEVIEAFDWYEREVPGLGEQFRVEVDHQIERVRADPLQFPLMLADVRRARLRRFPYSLFFRPSDHTVLVLACFHSSRDPRRWKMRARKV